MTRICFFTSMALFAGCSAVQPTSTSDEERPVISGKEVAKLAVFAPHPQYPLAARARHVTGSGTFILHIQVRTGLVRYVDVERSTGSASLDSAALSALKRWRFKPNTLPVIAEMHLRRPQPYPTEDCVARVPINFVMR